MPEFKVTQAQYDRIKNHSVHYDISTTWDWKEQAYVFDCDHRTAKIINKILSNELRE